jgi:hypothetical protein
MPEPEFKQGSFFSWVKFSLQKNPYPILQLNTKALRNEPEVHIKHKPDQSP